MTTSDPLGVDREYPALYGTGPVEASTCRALSVLPGWIADVNGYYRELGVSPYATRKEIGRAYTNLDGQSSDRLTFVFTQLLDKQTRRAYDCCPLGQQFMDPWIQRELYLQMKRAAMAKADEEVRAGRITETREYASVVDSIMEWLIDGFEAADTLPDVLDGDGSEGEDGSAPAKAHLGFPFSYYLWKTSYSEDAEHRLAEWQRLLLAAFAEHDDRPERIAVGLHGMPHRFLNARVGYRETFLLNCDLDPDIEIARSAVRSYIDTPTN